MLKKLIRIKVKYDRSAQYYNYIKTLFGLFMFYGIFADRKIGIWLFDHRFTVVPVVLVVYVFSRWYLGHLDKKHKIREFEIGEYNATDPNIRMIQKYLIDIKQILDDNRADSISTKP